MRKVLSIFLVLLLVMSFSVVYADQQTGGESTSSGHVPKWAPPDYVNETEPHSVIGGPTTDIDLGEPIIVTDPQNGSSTESNSGIRVLVNGIEVTFPDVQPYIKSNRTLVPVRFVVEELGAQVDWNQKNKEVTIEKDGKKIQLKINSKDILVNNQKIAIDVPAELKGDRTMVPLRFISEAFGANVGWDGTNKIVTITTK